MAIFNSYVSLPEGKYSGKPIAGIGITLQTQLRLGPKSAMVKMWY